MAINLGSWNLIGGPQGIGIPLPFGGRVGVGEQRAGAAVSGGPTGLIGDTVKVRGRQRGFLILERAGGQLTFVKTAKSRRGATRGGSRGAGMNKMMDRMAMIAMMKAMK